MSTGVIQATAPAQRPTEAVLHKSAHHLPVQLDRSMPTCDGDSCTAAFNSACCSPSRVGEPPVCPKTSADGPPSVKATAQRPMVWASLPTPRLPPLRSSPASITTMRATAPALGALALGKSAAVPQLRPIANAPAAPSAPSCPTATPTPVFGPTNSIALNSTQP